MIRIRSLFLVTALSTFGAVSIATAQVRLLGIDGTNLVELNPLTGAVVTTIPLTGGPAGGVGALTWDSSSGTMFLSSTTQDTLWTVDIGTGALTLIGPYNVPGAAMSGLEVDDAGQLYAYTSSLAGGILYSVNRTTGQATTIANTAISGLGSIAFVPSTGTMYLADTTLDRLLTIDRTTGAIGVVGPYGPLSGAAGQIGISLAYHPQFGMYATNNTSTDGLFTIDLATGTATLVSNLTTNNLISLAFAGASAAPGTSFCFGDGTGTACPCGNSSPVGANAGCLSSLNFGGKLVSSGTASLANDSVVLLGTDMPNSSALYFQGTVQQAGGLGVAFGDGLRCAGGTIVRLATATNAGGASQYPFGALPSVSVKGNVTAPGTRTYQVWYRNAAAFCTPSTFNLTNGRQLTWGP